MEIKKIEELAAIVCRNQLTRLELTEGDSRLVLEAAGKPAEKVLESVENTAPAVEKAQEYRVEKTERAEKTEAPAGVEQKSPLVGTVYLSPESGAEPFVEVGDTVKKGDVLCIVESMKMFNQIASEWDGVIEEICVDNGQIVEYGQPLCRICPA